MAEEQIMPMLATVAGEASQRRAVQRALAARQFLPVAQPIVSLRTGEVAGYEALTRPQCDPPLNSPERFLAIAGEVGLLFETDRLWRELAVAEFAPVLPPGARLFVNVSPRSIIAGKLHAEDAGAIARKYRIPPERLVFELTEGDHIEDFDQLRRSLAGLRNAGFLIAIDDAGAGQTSLQSTVELRPHFIKVDKWLVQGIAIDRARQTMVEAMTGFAHRMRAEVIAEGIETEEDLRAVMAAGVDFGQGYFFARPASILCGIVPSVRSFILDEHERGRASTAFSGARRMGDLAVFAPVVPSTTASGQVLDVFRSNDVLEAVVIEETGRVLGVVTRGQILQLFAGPFGLPVYGKLPIARLAVAAAVVQRNETARTAARLAMERPPAVQQDPVVVLEGEQFVGIVSVTDLLQQLLREEVEVARDANPLTGLPGNRAIRAYLESKTTEEMIVLYVDIDHFKAFNDRYGFAHGDIAIQQLGEILTDAARAAAGAEPFVGHIGGDDFVVVVHRDGLPAVREALLPSLAGRWFDPASRTSAEKLGVTVAGIAAAGNAAGTYEDRARLVAHAKSLVKAQGGDCFILFEEFSDLEPMRAA